MDRDYYFLAKNNAMALNKEATDPFCKGSFIHILTVFNIPNKDFSGKQEHC